MKRFLKCMVCSAIICVPLSYFSSLTSAELIAPTRTLSEAKEQPGKLSVFSEPPALAVTLDGSDIGKTPVVAQEVEPGTHLIRIEDSETEIFVKPGQPLQYSWFKGSFIEVPVEKKEVRQHPKAEQPEPSQKPPSERSEEKKEDSHPLYWPLNPTGPIY
jgi:hypothetical protein